MDIPVEFSARFWVTTPKGLQGSGSGFLLAENIQDIYAVDCKINDDNNFSKTTVTSVEIEKPHYLEALCQLIFESWTENRNLIIIGSQQCVEHILTFFIMKYGQVTKEIAFKFISSKITRPI